MFTGLIKEVGSVASVTTNAEGKRLRINSKKLISEIGIDDSVSVNGACQTAVEVGPDYFDVQAVHVTLEKTTLGELRPGSIVNLELAMQLSDRLGGHLVQGHVNGVTTLKKVVNQGDNYVLTLELNPDHSRYIVKEGSVCLNGISLTVSDVDREEMTFCVSIIPHTWENTVLHSIKIGQKMNIEVDILAKYVENLLRHRSEEEKSQVKKKINKKWLEEQGY